MMRRERDNVVESTQEEAADGEDGIGLFFASVSFLGIREDG